MTDTPTPSRDDLAAAIATIKQGTRASAEACEGDTWTAADISQPYEPCEVDAAIATILNAVVSGELVSRTPQLAAEVLARRAPSAPVEVAGLVARAHETLPGIETPAMMGDNLEVFLCGYLDNPHQEPDEFTGWTPDGMAGYEQIVAAIRAHYDAAFTAASAAKDAEIARLTAERNDSCRDHGEAVDSLEEMAEQRDDWKARAERAEAALAESEAKLAVAYETAAKAIDQRGTEEQRNFGLGRETQNFYRARDLVRALDPDATAALAAYVKQAVEAETRACAEIAAEILSRGHCGCSDPQDIETAILARLNQPAGEA